MYRTSRDTQCAGSAIRGLRDTWVWEGTNSDSTTYGILPLATNVTGFRHERTRIQPQNLQHEWSVLENYSVQIHAQIFQQKCNRIQAQILQDANTNLQARIAHLPALL